MGNEKCGINNKSITILVLWILWGMSKIWQISFAEWTITFFSFHHTFDVPLPWSEKPLTLFPQWQVAHLIITKTFHHGMRKSPKSEHTPVQLLLSQWLPPPLVLHLSCNPIPWMSGDICLFSSGKSSSITFSTSPDSSLNISLIQ